MVIRRRLLEAGYRLRPRTPNPEAMNPLDKVYLRPAQIKAIERLAAQRHGITRHAMARELIDLALRQFDPLYAKADQVETGPGGSSTVPASAPLRQPESPGRGMRGGTADP